VSADLLLTVQLGLLVLGLLAVAIGHALVQRGRDGADR
jgi:hypothetical protein